MARLRQLEPVEKRIGEYIFYIKPFPAMVAANLSGELASLLMPLISGILPLVGNDSENLMDIDISQAAASMSKSMEGFSGQKVENMMKKLLVSYKNVVVEMPQYDGDIPTGETEKEVLNLDIANEIFCGEVQDMFVLAYYVIALNFNGFFRKLANLSGKGGGEPARKIRQIF